MSVAPGHPLLRSRIASAVAYAVGEIGQRPLGRRLGTSGNTVARWGEDLHAWPADCFLDLALHVPEIKEAIGAYFDGRELEQGEPIAATRAIFATIEDSAKLIHEASKDLADGHLDQAEARRLLPILETLHALLGQSAIPNVRAAAHG